MNDIWPIDLGGKRLAAWLTLFTFTVLSMPMASAQGQAGKEVPPLPAAQGRVVHVSTAALLRSTLEEAASDTTILIDDGHYPIDRAIYLRGKKNVTIRSASGDPAKVIISGQGWGSQERGDDILRIGDCENITVAQLTVADCNKYGIKVEAEHYPKEIHIYDCHFRNIGTRAIKGSGGEGLAKGGSIRFCHFENTKVPPADWLYDGNYISAIDMMALDGWTISDNTFRNIKGRTGSGRAAVFLWVRSKNVIVERNLIVDCDRGIAFGNPSMSSSPVAAEESHMKDGICRNNFVVAGPDAGIELWWVDGAEIYHNTIWRDDVTGRGIRYGSRNKGVHVANNLVRGAIKQGDAGAGGGVRLENNLSGSLDGYFLDPARGDLHITPRATAAIDKAVPLNQIEGDFDSHPRDQRPDIGAAEFTADKPGQK